MSQSVSSRKRRPRPVVLKLPADLGIEHAAALHAQLGAQLQQPQVQLDAGDVARIHAAALQVFCLFCRDRRAAGHETVWSRPTEVLRSSAALLGMATLLQIVREETAAA